MKNVFYLVAGGGFQWESLTLIDQLRECWSVTYVIPETSIYDGSAILKAIDGSEHIAVPDVSSRASNRLDRTLLNICKVVKTVYPAIKEKRPDAVVCVGSSLSFPLAIAARRFGIKVIFIESITRTGELSSTGKLLSVLGLADEIYVQWPDQEKYSRRAQYRGTVL